MDFKLTIIVILYFALGNTPLYLFYYFIFPQHGNHAYSYILLPHPMYGQVTYYKYFDHRVYLLLTV